MTTHRTRIRSLTGLALLALTLALSLSARANPCAGLSINTCALPFPSNAFTVADPGAVTGRAVAFPDAAFAPSAYGSLPNSTRPSTIFAGADGFAATTPIIFELSQNIPLGSIPADGGNFVFVFDAETGERIPVIVDFDRAATGPAGAQNILYVWPRSRFDYGRTYAAYVYAAIPTESGQSAALPPAFLSAWAQGQSVFTQFAVPFFDLFGGLAAATEFTVRSAGNAQAQLDQMVTTALAQQHPISAINIQPNFGLFGSEVKTVVFGEVEVTDFRDPSTGALSWFPGFTGNTSNVPFVLTIPGTPAGPNGAPIIIYGHGLGVSKETVLAVSNANAKRGMATISLEQPLHSQTGPEPFIFNILVPSEIERVLAMPYQSVIHYSSLLQSLQTAFVGQDWHPWNLEAAVLPGLFDHGDGVPDLDTSFFLYEGTSLGGVLGSTFVAQNPQIPAALLQVSGAGTAHTLLNSGFWDQFARLLPDTATIAEQAAIYGLAAHALDGSDASNFVDRIPASGQSLLSIYTHLDPVVYNPASERLIELTGGTLYGPLQYDVPHLPYSSGPRPADGNGAYQLSGIPDEFGDVFSQLNHLLFLADPGGQAELDGWIQDRLLEAGY